MTDPTPTTPPLDLAALRGWIEAGIRMAKEHALALIARAESAEAKIAAVREMCTELRDLPVSPDAPDYARQVLTGARSTATDVLAALDGAA